MKDCGDCGSSHAFANVSLLLAVFLKPLRLHTCCSLHGGGHLSLCLDSLESAYLSLRLSSTVTFTMKPFMTVLCKMGQGFAPRTWSNRSIVGTTLHLLFKYLVPLVD